VIAGTLFSGIGAPECAAPHFEWRWSAEIDPFASAVHAARFPGTPNLGNVEGIDADAIEPVDLIVFGSPCQSFSVAGRRLGLDDPRGNLALVALRLVERLRPGWFVFENVPGLLSSDGGRDFGAFLGTVEQCGYGWAYRTLDAQFAGVPQRRRRVFVVGHLGDWHPAAAVLFEPESLLGDTAPRREAGERIARTLTHGVDSGGKGGYAGRRREDDDNLVAFCLNAHAGRIDGESETFIAHSLRGRSQPSHREDSDTYVAHTLRADGFDAGEDGTGRGTPIVPAQMEISIANLPDPARGRTPGLFGCGTADRDRRGNCDQDVTPAIPILEAGARTGKSTTDPRAGIGIGEPGDPMFTVRSGKQHAVAFQERTRTNGRNIEAQDDLLAYALTAPNGGGRRQEMNVANAMSVRRLTPRECERLQGFPDDFTAITYRGKPAADGPRYRALGNSMAVPVIGWVLGRIREFEAKETAR